MQPIQILLGLLLGLPLVAALLFFAVAYVYLRLRLPSTTQKAQQLQQHIQDTKHQLIEIQPYLTRHPASAAPLSQLDVEAMDITLTLVPLLKTLELELIPYLRNIWQVTIDSRLLIPFKAIERISKLEEARKKVDAHYAAYLRDHSKLARLAEIRQEYVTIQQHVDTFVNKKMAQVDGLYLRLTSLHESNLQDLYDEEMRIDQLADNMLELEELFSIPSLAEHPEWVSEFRAAYDAAFPRLSVLNELFTTLNCYLHRLTRTHLYFAREHLRLEDLNGALQQQLSAAQGSGIDVADLWQKYQAAQGELQRVQQVYRHRTPEAYESLTGSLIKRDAVADAPLKLISAELQNLLRQTRSRVLVTEQYEHLLEAIQLLGDLHEEILGLAELNGRAEYADYLSTIADLSLEFERRRESLEAQLQKEERQQSAVSS